MAQTRKRLGAAQRWVVKIGSALITGDGKGLDRDGLRNWVDQLADLLDAGHEIVLVSSGAVVYLLLSLLLLPWRPLR